MGEALDGVVRPAPRHKTFVHQTSVLIVLPVGRREREAFWQEQLDSLRQSQHEAQAEAQQLLQQEERAAVAADEAVVAAVAERDAAWQHSQEQAAAAAAAERDEVWRQQVQSAQQEQHSLQAEVRI